MVKKLHYIKEDHSSSIEKICFNACKSLYPDFEFMAWKPGSSPLRILYDHGGLFIGPHMMPVNRIPEELLERSFLVYDNSFDSKLPNINSCCCAGKVNDPIYLSFMENGIQPVLKDKIPPQPFKPYQNEFDIFTDEISILNKSQFGFLDKANRTYPDYNDDVYVVDMNTRKWSGEWHMHYLVINKDTSSNNVYSICENFIRAEYKDDSKHFLLLICNDWERDLTSRMGEFLTYHIIGNDKAWDTVMVKGNIGEVLTEHISRNFEKILSCERVM